MATAISAICTCSDLQLDHVGCECEGEPRRRPTMQQLADEEDRIAELLAEEALERARLEEEAFWEGERAKDAARGWAWNPSWGIQPADEQVRAYRTHLDKVEAILLAA